MPNNHVPTCASVCRLCRRSSSRWFRSSWHLWCSCCHRWLRIMTTILAIVWAPIRRCLSAHTTRSKSSKYPDFTWFTIDCRLKSDHEYSTMKQDNVQYNLHSTVTTLYNYICITGFTLSLVLSPLANFTENWLNKHFEFGPIFANFTDSCRNHVTASRNPV